MRLVAVPCHFSSLYFYYYHYYYYSNIQKNAARKYKKYETVLEELKLSYNRITFINLSMGACGVIGASAVDFPSMLKSIH